jgi:hypothetical protein
MGYISESCSRLKCKQIVRNYFESSHDKGPQDAAGGSVKHQASMAIIRGTDVIVYRIWTYNEKMFRNYIWIFLRTVNVVILEYCMSINYGHM